MQQQYPMYKIYFRLQVRWGWLFNARMWCCMEMERIPQYRWPVNYTCEGGEIWSDFGWFLYEKSFYFDFSFWIDGCTGPLLMLSLCWLRHCLDSSYRNISTIVQPTSVKKWDVTWHLPTFKSESLTFCMLALWSINLDKCWSKYLSLRPHYHEQVQEVPTFNSY